MERKILEMKTGRMSNANRAKREREEKIAASPGKLGDPPAWLTNPDAKREWRRLAKELNKMDIIGNLDRDNLAAYCNALANYIQTVKALEGQPLIIENDGRQMKNPLIAAQKIYAEEMRQFARLCGLTIDSRLKAAAIKTAKEEDTIEKEFGAI